MIKAIPMEDWLRGCVYHDGRHGYVTLPTDEVLKIANYIQRTRRSTTDGLIDLEVVTADRKTEPQTETERPQGEWIPCSERLPKENTEVLITLKWGIDIGEYRNGNWYSELINHYDDDNVLAWKPLPKPYRERESE